MGAYNTLLELSSVLPGRQGAHLKQYWSYVLSVTRSTGDTFKTVLGVIFRLLPGRQRALLLLHLGP